MEIDITPLVDRDLRQYSSSIAESGPDAGRITWNNAKDCRLRFVTEENHQDFRDYFQEFGAWTEEEIAEWSLNEVNALFIQEASACLREFLDARDLPLDEYQDWEENCGGRVYICDVPGHAELGRYFYYVGM